MCIKHIDPHMTFGDQRIGASEKKKCGIPEPNQVTHERLFIGKNKSCDNDLKLGHDDQKRKPGKAHPTREEPDDKPQQDQRVVHIGTAITVSAKIHGGLFTDEGG
ncbi:MAG: hypothetical protein CM1200mP20_14690 [Pseudomonadota bacterium]|nr:MAG: hypothetical protein CM1200mP20_14690 [Pseudomonadota bacterium]